MNTVLFMSGLYFALRSGDEHGRLRLRPPQITVHTDAKEDEAAYLFYIEDSSKNHQGGLKQRKVVSKKVKHFANTQDPARCFVRIFQLYLSKLPTDAPESSFYFKPVSKFAQSTAWFSKQPIGHNTLTKMMSSICISAGVQGFKTNHSLRATSATRLYQKCVDEQLIMERTGHRSIEGRSQDLQAHQQRTRTSRV